MLNQVVETSIEPTPAEILPLPDTQKIIKRRSKKTFLIIILLTVILFGSFLFNKSVQRSLIATRNRQRFEDLQNIKTVLSLYFIDNKKFPTELNMMVPKYISAIPADPSSGQPVRNVICQNNLADKNFIYKYSADQSGKTFVLMACMENDKKGIYKLSY